MIPDEATIREMMGEELTRLAWEMGLAPGNMSEWPGVEGYWATPCDRWRPHLNVDQAREVFCDRLRALGLFVVWYATAQHGECRVARTVAPSTSGRDLASVQWGYEDITEPLALLRCACLAMAHMKREALSAQGVLLYQLMRPFRNEGFVV